MSNAVLAVQDILSRSLIFEDRRQALVFGGQVQASKVMALLATSPNPIGGFSINIFADEFIVDEDINGVSSATILAQKVTIPMARSWHWAKAEGKYGFNSLDLVCSQINGGPLNFAIGSPAEIWSVDNIESRPTRITIKTGMSSGNTVSDHEDELVELTGHPSFGPYLSGAFLRAANMLGRVDDVQLEEAIAIFRWVKKMTNLALKGNRASVADMSDLSLLTGAMLDIAVGKEDDRLQFVPGMKLDFYHGRLDELIGIIKGYENSLEHSEIKQQISKSSSELADYLKLKATNDIDTLKRRLSDTTKEITALGHLLEQQRVDYIIRANDVCRAKDRLEFAMTLKATIEAMVTIMEITGAVISIGVTIGPAFSTGKKAGSEAGNIFSEAREMVENADDVVDVDSYAEAVKIVERGALQYGLSKSIPAALKKLTETEGALEKLAKGFKDLFSTSPRIMSIAEILSVDLTLPEDFSDNLLIVRGTDIAWTEMEDSIQSGIEPYLSDMSEARSYRDKVKYQFMLARALVGTQVSMVERAAEVLEIARQIKAAEASQDRLEALIARAESDFDREELVQGHYVRRIVAIKRAVLVCAERFRATYVYRILTEAPLAINFAMSADDLGGAITQIGQRASETGGEGGPGQDTLIECTLPVEIREPADQDIEQEKPPAATKNNVVTAVKTESGTYLTFSLSPDTLPDDWSAPTRPTAFFVHQARFFFVGAEWGDTSETIAMRVTASGPVENLCKSPENFPKPVYRMPGRSMPFAFKRISDKQAIVADHAFVVDDEYCQVTTPWALENGLVYRSPFSVWSLEIPASVEILPSTKLAVQFDAKRIEL